MVPLKTKTYNLKTPGGQAILSLVFLIGGIIVLIGLTVAFFATSFINVASGFQAAERAKFTAASGAYDALMRLARAKDLSGSYIVPVGGLSAAVTITQFPSAGSVEIISAATVSNRDRKVRAVVSRNATSGEMSLFSWGYIE